MINYQYLKFVRYVNIATTLEIKFVMVKSLTNNAISAYTYLYCLMLGNK